MLEPVACALCGETRFTLSLRVPDPQRAGVSFSLVECVACHLVYLNPRPDQASLLRDYYGASYCAHQEDTVRDALPDWLKLNRKAVVEKLQSRGRVLDVGCGRGQVLAELQQSGWEVYGIEPSSHACHMARELLKTDTIWEGDALDAPWPPGSFDVVTFWHVLEHVPDPLKVMKRVREWLKEDGVVVLNCPNYASPTRALFGAHWDLLKVPTHFFHFTPATLRALLEQSGFQGMKNVKRWADPFTDMSHLKSTVFKACGFRVTALDSIRNPQSATRNVPLGWKIVRGLVNIMFMIGALAKGWLGFQEVLLVTASPRAAKGETIRA